MTFTIILQGSTGSGKTYLSCVLGKQACLKQIKTNYIRFPDLLMEYGNAILIQGQLLHTFGKIHLRVDWINIHFFTMLDKKCQ
ncbi:MAG: ATP-binding protein [Lachnospiraceae bacterium]